MDRLFIDLCSKGISVTECTDSGSKGYLYPSSVKFPRYLACTRYGFVKRLLNSENKSRYLDYCGELYSCSDLSCGITYLEVAYLLYFVGGRSRVLDWSSVACDRSVSVEVKISSNGVVEECLYPYLRSYSIEKFISLIIEGKEPIPMPMYCAWCDLLASGVVKDSDMFRYVPVDILDKLV